MVHQTYAYWLYVNPIEGRRYPKNTLSELLDTLRKSEIAHPNGPMAFNIVNQTTIMGHTCADSNHTEKNDRVKAVIENIAEQSPDYKFLLEITDKDETEELEVCQYADGKLVGTKRTLQPGQYDKPTIDMVAQWLRLHNYADAARKLETHDFTKGVQ